MTGPTQSTKDTGAPHRPGVLKPIFCLQLKYLDPCLIRVLSESGLAQPSWGPHCRAPVCPTSPANYILRVGPTDPFPEPGTSSHLLALEKLSQVHLPGTNLLVFHRQPYLSNNSAVGSTLCSKHTCVWKYAHCGVHAHALALHTYSMSVNRLVLYTYVLHMYLFTQL